MNQFLLASVSEKRQITIPQFVCEALGIKPHSMVGFRFERGQVKFVPIEINEKNPYTREEWKKIEKLANQKGKVFKSGREAKKYLNNL